MDQLDINQVSFQAHLDAGRLMAVRCQNCAALYLPPRPLCPACYGDMLEWVELTGRGTLAAFTTIHIGPAAMLEAGYGRDNPYCAGIVRLSEGPSISAQILGVDPRRPDTIRIGTPLQLALITRGDGEEKKTFLAFEPTEN